MNQYQLRQLIKKGESRNLEFKQRVTKPDRFAKTVSSIANTQGGILLVGVNDDHSINGIDPFEEQYVADEIIKYNIHPPLHVKFSTIETDDGLVLMLKIPNSEFKPHRALSKKGEWQTYVRFNDKSVLMSERQEKIQKKGITQSIRPLKRKLSRQEKSLLVYLYENEKITLKKFCQLVNFSERRARKTVNELLYFGLLREHTFEKAVFYSL
ncbi:ATP-binding protein [Flammeovirga sp. MY04]|uniref:AlbA family DNA-binding domain-containing protein n=1 Tax=Flammeovirga sp. MY04 TaxID=1191459 RepID=UPI00080637AF|nr:ATP-binding protein [Flammeovirga sp. MY04]ANQ49137.1 ATP-binding protein [Flammeovirga sp. MY04]